MKELVEFLANKNRLFKSFDRVDNKAHKIRKKIDIFDALSLKGAYTLIFVITQKSRFLNKDVDTIESLQELLSQNLGHNFKDVTLFINSPLCSKAKAKMANELQWKVYHDAL